MRRRRSAESKVKGKVKGGGQECPPHTGRGKVKAKLLGGPVQVGAVEVGEVGVSGEGFALVSVNDELDLGDARNRGANSAGNRDERKFLDQYSTAMLIGEG